MKKIIPVVCIVAAIVIALLVAHRPERDAPFARVFPEGALAYVGVSGGRGIVDEVIRSNCWRRLSAVESVTRINSAVSEAGIGVLAALLGEESAAALYGSGGPSGSGLLIAVNGADERELRRLLGSFDCVSEGSYRGVELFAFKIPALLVDWTFLFGQGATAPPGPILSPSSDIKGCYAWVGETLIAALSESRAPDLVKAALDHHAGIEKKSLSQDERFKKALGKPFMEREKLFACSYMDWQSLEREAPQLPLVGTMKKRLREKNPRAFEKLARLWSAQPGCLYMAARFYRDGGIVARGRAVFDTGRMTEEQRALCFGKPGKLRVLGLVPANSIFLSARDMHSPRALWNLYREQADSAPQFAPLLRIEEFCGIDIERDLLPWFGGELSLSLSDVRTGGLFPIPCVQLLVETTDSRVAEKKIVGVMERFASPSAPNQPRVWAFLKPQLLSEEYRGNRIMTLAYPLPGFSPSAALLGKYAVIGSAGSSVTEIIDIANGQGESIEKNSKFAEMRRLVPEQLDQLTYLDCERALEIGEGILSWFFTMKKLTLIGGDPERVKEVERLEKDLPGILSSLKVFRAFLGARTSAGNTVEQFSVLRMADIR